jgi:RHS repeat-associated protein
VTGQTPTNYSYNQADELTSVATGSTTIGAYTYDGTGLRASETAGGTTYHFAYNTVASTPLILTDGQDNYIYGPTNTPVEQISNSGTETYLHHDALGSVRRTGNQSGGFDGSATYNAYGAVANTTGTIDTRFGYAGAYTDPVTGLIYLDARYYDPTTGQFLSVDPLNAVTQQPYSYTDDDPINGTDPTGLLCLSLHCVSDTLSTVASTAGECPRNCVGLNERDVHAFNPSDFRCSSEGL